MRKSLSFLIILLLPIFYLTQSKQDSLQENYFWVDIDTLKVSEGLATELKDCVLGAVEKPNSDKLIHGVFLVEDYILCNQAGKPQFIFKIYDGSANYFVKSSDVIIEDKGVSLENIMQFFATMKPDEKKLYKSYLQDFVNELVQRQKQKEQYDADEPLRISISDMMKQPLIVYDFGFPGEYSFIGFRAEIINTSKKRIKYISFNVMAFNEVNDAIQTFGGGYSKTLRGVGPVEVGNSASWEFESIWYDNTFHTGRINSITVEYFDGTKRTFSKIGPMVFNNEERELFDRYVNSAEENE